MLCELAHRRRDDEIASRVDVDAASSRQAIDNARSKLPGDEVVLHVRQMG